MQGAFLTFAAERQICHECRRDIPGGKLACEFCLRLKTLNAMLATAREGGTCAVYSDLSTQTVHGGAVVGRQYVALCGREWEVARNTTLLRIAAPDLATYPYARPCPRCVAEVQQ